MRNGSHGPLLDLHIDYLHIDYLHLFTYYTPLFFIEILTEANLATANSQQGPLFNGGGQVDTTGNMWMI